MRTDLRSMLVVVLTLVAVVVLMRLVEVMGAPICWPEGGISQC